MATRGAAGDAPSASERDVELVTLDAVREAQVRLAGVARRTPLLDVSVRLDAGALPASRLLLKCENMQPIGAFKIRGAYNMAASMPEEERRNGLITFSSGNHGQAVAMAARVLGVPAVVVMPTTSAKVKVAGVRHFGAEVIFAGTTASERLVRGHDEAARRKLAIVPPFDHEAIIAGQGTAALEILEQCPGVTEIVAPIGGGSMISGISAVVKRLRPDVRITGVEPVNAAKMQASLHAGHPVGIDGMSSIAEGLLAVRPGRLTLAHTRAFVDSVVTVTDDDLIDAMQWLFHQAKLVVEPSGAAGLAHVLTRSTSPTRGPVVTILTGGNVDVDAFCALMSSARTLTA